MVKYAVKWTTTQDKVAEEVAMDPLQTKDTMEAEDHLVEA